MPNPSLNVLNSIPVPGDRDSTCMIYVGQEVTHGFIARYVWVQNLLMTWA